MDSNKSLSIHSLEKIPYLYLQDAPAALAIERSAECDLLARYQFNTPVLDVGCGEGIFAAKLFVEKIDVGIDPNGRELDCANGYQKYKELIKCMGDNIPKPDKSFATIFSNSVLEHIPELDPVLKEMHRLLKDDGVIYLTLPTNKFERYSWGYSLLSLLGLKGFAKKYAEKFNKFWRHYHCHDQDSWSAIFNKNGFNVEECHEYNSRFRCLLNNFLAPFAIFSFINKKLFNSWFVFKGKRKISSYVLYRIFKPWMSYKKLPKGKGGLIFFKLHKKT